MVTHMRNWLLVGFLGLLVACGGGGGGNSASGVDPGPPPPGQPIPPDPNPPAPSETPYADATVLNAFITEATMNDDNQPVIKFTLSDAKNVAITDLTSGDVRFVVAKLEGSDLGNLTGTWQSYVNAIASPQYGSGTDPKLQASYERDDGRHPFGTFTNNGDGSYSYQYATNLSDLDQDILDQAAAEGLNLSYEPNRTHRVSMQFDNTAGWANPHRDWVPATGATDGIFTMDIAATATCNRCHDPLGVHGGGVGPRREVEYCVTCHNPGTTDPDSTNTVDMKVMIHKIHMGANLPSVQAGEPYVIYGFGGSAHDYSNLHYPQDIRNCVNCHAGSATGSDLEYPAGEDYEVTQTSQGDNWAEVPSGAACGSCHDKSFGHIDRNEDSECASCHSTGGIAGSIEDSHQIPNDEARKQFAAEILEVTNTGPGEFPVVQYKIVDPTKDNAAYDLQNDPPWTVGGGASRLEIDLAWATTDYTNSGSEEGNANAVGLNALEGTPVGDGSYTIESTVAIPDGSLPPGIPATGSGMVGIEGHPAVNVGSEEEPDVQRIAFTNPHDFFSIDEADGEASDRRTSVELGNCLSCHQTLSLHGSNRTDNIQVCVACHNPRNTDKRRRVGSENEPTDGKDEESVDFKTMVHAIHAPAIRENPLEVFGFGGSKHVYDTDTVHYPGNLANCVACHTESGFQLPLASGVLGTTVDTGSDPENPRDDRVTTPITAVCASCHDDSDASSHMVKHGGNFSTTQAAIDSGQVFEDCNSCHKEGSGVADAWEVHQRFLE